MFCNRILAVNTPHKIHYDIDFIRYLKRNENLKSVLCVSSHFKKSKNRIFVGRTVYNPWQIRFYL